MSVSEPPPEIVAQVGPALDDYIKRVNALYRYVGGLGSCNSWHRSVSHNYRVGGHACSQHLYALASDWQTGDRTSAVVAAAPRFGLIAAAIAPSGSASHIQYYPAGTLRSLGVCPTLA